MNGLWPLFFSIFLELGMDNRLITFLKSGAVSCSTSGESMLSAIDLKHIQ